MTSGMSAGTSGRIPAPGFSLEIACEIIDFLKAREVERTRRAIITSLTEIEIERIGSDGRAFDECMSGAFNKRSKAAMALTALLTTALDREDVKQSSLILRALSALIVRSPLDESSIRLLTRSSSTRTQDTPKEGSGS